MASPPPDPVGDAPITGTGAAAVPQGPERKIGIIFDQYQPFSNQQIKEITQIEREGIRKENRYTTMDVSW